MPRVEAISGDAAMRLCDICARQAKIFTLENLAIWTRARVGQYAELEDKIYLCNKHIRKGS